MRRNEDFVHGQDEWWLVQTRYEGRSGYHWMPCSTRRSAEWMIALMRSDSVTNAATGRLVRAVALFHIKPKPAAPKAQRRRGPRDTSQPIPGEVLREIMGKRK